MNNKETFDTGFELEGSSAHPFEKTRLEDVAGCLEYLGKSLSIEEMNEVVSKGIKKDIEASDKTGESSS